MDMAHGKCQHRFVVARDLVDDGTYHGYEVRALLRQEARKRPGTVLSISAGGHDDAGPLVEFDFPLENLVFCLRPSEPIPTLDKPIVNWEWMPRWMTHVVMQYQNLWHATTALPELDPVRWIYRGDWISIPTRYAPHWRGNWRESLCIRSEGEKEDEG